MEGIPEEDLKEHEKQKQGSHGGMYGSGLKIIINSNWKLRVMYILRSHFVEITVFVSCESSIVE